MRNFFLENHTQNVVEKILPGPFLENQNWTNLWIDSLKFYTVCFNYMSIWGLSEYIETKLQTTCSYLISLYRNHVKTSNFDICLLNFISTCHFCLIQKIIHHLKRNWPRFSLPKFFSSSIYVITIVKIINSSTQTLFNFPERTSTDFCKVI